MLPLLFTKSGPLPVIVQNWETSGAVAYGAITAANSAGNGNQAITSTTVTGGTTITYNDVVVHGGGYSAFIDHGGVSSTGYITMKATNSIGNRFAFRDYIYIPSGAGATLGTAQLQLLGFHNSAGTQIANLGFTTTGLLALGVSGGVNATVPASALPRDQWVRVEGVIAINNNGNNDGLELYVFAGDSGVTTAANAATGISLGTQSIDTVRIGWSGASVVNVYHDDVAFDRNLVTGLIGPTGKYSLPFTESWTGTTGAAWPGYWDMVGGSSSIQANAGSLTTPAGSQVSAQGTVGYYSFTNVDYQVNVTGTTAGVDQSVTAFVGDINGNSLGVLISFNATAANSTVSLVIDGATIPITVTTKSLTGNLPYRIRLNRVDNMIRVKVFFSTIAEPSAWTFTYTLTPTDLSNLGGATFDQFGVIARNGADGVARTFTFDNLYITDRAQYPFMDALTGTDGASWPTFWKPVGSGGTYSIQSNTGVLTGVTDIARIDLKPVTIAYADRIEMTFDVTAKTTAQNSSFYISVGDGTTTKYNLFLNSGFYTTMSFQAAGGAPSTSEIGHTNASGTITGSNIGTANLVPNVKYSVRIQRSYGVVAFRIWNSASAEPTTWTNSYDVIGNSATAVSLGTDYGSSFAVDNFILMDYDAVEYYHLTENFVGTNGSAWPSGWVATTNTVLVGAGTIQNNQGQLITPATAGSGIREDNSGMIGLSSTDYYGTFRAVTAGVDQTIQFSFASDLGNTAGKVEATGTYMLQLHYAATAASSTIDLLKTNSGNVTMFQSVTKTLTGGVDYHFRVLRFNNIINARVWAVGTAEPTTWDVGTTLATTVSGKIAISAVTGTAVARTFLITDIAAAEPMSMPTFSVGLTGEVKVYVTSSFVAKPAKVWTGSAWVTKPAKVWNGSAWALTNY